MTLRELFKYVMKAIGELKSWNSSDAKEESQQLGKFNLSVSLSELLLPATRTLQTVGADLVKAMTLVSYLLTALNNLIYAVSFHNLRVQSVFIADQILDNKLMKPCTVSRSVYRSNAKAEDGIAESYYCVNFFYPTLEKVIQSPYTTIIATYHTTTAIHHYW